MRKGWKIFWIVCAVLAAVGILLFAAGAALGGLSMLRHSEEGQFVSSWLDRMGITVRRNISVTQELEDLENIDEINTNDGAYTTPEPDGAEVTAYSGITELNLEVSMMAVTVLPWDGDEIVVDISEVRSDLTDRIHITQDGEELDIEMDDPGKWNTNNVGRMHVSVPRGMTLDKVSADAGVGSIDMEGVAARALSVNAGTGSADISSFSVERLEASSGIGQIILNGEVTARADINCSMGEVILTLPGTREAYNFEVSSSMGSVTLDGEDFSGIGSTVREDNGSGCWINTSCSMGSVEIEFE